MSNQEPARRGEVEVRSPRVGELISQGRTLLAEHSPNLAFERLREAFVTLGKRSREPSEAWLEQRREIACLAVGALGTLVKRDRAFVVSKLAGDEVVQEMIREAQEYKAAAGENAPSGTE